MKTEDLKYILETLEYGLKDCSDDNNDTTTHFNRFQNSIDVVERELNKNDIIPNVVQQSELFTCKLEGGKDSCNFTSKDYMACVTLRKCPFASE